MVASTESTQAAMTFRKLFVLLVGIAVSIVTGTDYDERCFKFSTICSYDGGDCDVTENKCRCEYDSHVYNYNTNKCEPEKPLGYPCSKNADCTTKYSVCSITEERCGCKDGFYDNDGSIYSGTCLENVDIGGSCKTHAGCKTPNAYCVADVCTCKDGFNQVFEEINNVTRGKCLPGGTTEIESRDLNKLTPVGFAVNNVTNTSITVTWTKPVRSDDIACYNISWAMHKGEGPYSSAILTNNCMLCAFVVVDLEAGEKYRIKITAKTDCHVDELTGVSETSEVATVHSTRPNRPGPIDLDASELDATGDHEITIHWKEPAAGGYQYFKLGIVSVQPKGYGGYYNSYKGHKNSLKMFISDSGRKLNTTIQACIDNDNVPTCSDKYSTIVTTKSFGPSEVRNVGCSLTDDGRSIELTWDPPLHDNGELTGFEISVYKYTELATVWKKMGPTAIDLVKPFKQITVGATAKRHTVEDLSRKYLYAFLVYAVNSVGRSRVHGRIARSTYSEWHTYGYLFEEVISQTYGVLGVGSQFPVCSLDINKDPVEKPMKLEAYKSDDGLIKTAWITPYQGIVLGFIMKVKNSAQECISELTMTCTEGCPNAVLDAPSFPKADPSCKEHTGINITHAQMTTVMRYVVTDIDPAEAYFLEVTTVGLYRLGDFNEVEVIAGQAEPVSTPTDFELKYERRRVSMRWKMENTTPIIGFRMDVLLNGTCIEELWLGDVPTLRALITNSTSVCAKSTFRSSTRKLPTKMYYRVRSQGEGNYTALLTAVDINVSGKTVSASNIPKPVLTIPTTITSILSGVIDNAKTTVVVKTEAENERSGNGNNENIPKTTNTSVPNTTNESDTKANTENGGMKTAGNDSMCERCRPVPFDKELLKLACSSGNVILTWKFKVIDSPDNQADQYFKLRQRKVLYKESQQRMPKNNLILFPDSKHCTCNVLKERPRRKLLIFRGEGLLSVVEKIFPYKKPFKKFFKKLNKKCKEFAKDR